MHLSEIAQQNPEKPAYIMAASGETVTYAALEAGSNQIANLFRSLGLHRGDHIAILLENHPLFLQICVAAQRAGLYFTAISYRLQSDEVEYIVKDCGAKVFITSIDRRAVVEPLLDKLEGLERFFMLDGVIAGCDALEAAIESQSTEVIADESIGTSMLYSSGTTGRPKGVYRALPEGVWGAEDPSAMFQALYGAGPDSIYLTPAPLYHAAPLAFTMGFLLGGMTCIVMEHFEALAALSAIETYKVTHSQWVPTMFIRMLKLDEADRTQFDLSSLK
ncbi:MAG: AMP-binding protein, partial [Pseudomonadales bacterium]